MLYFVLTSLYGQKDGIVQDQFNYKITYDLTYQPDSTNTELKKKEKMSLYIGNETSRFSSAGKAIGDSLKSAFDYSNFDQAAFVRMRKQIPGTEFEYYIYKGVPAEKITYALEIVTDKYRYTDNKNLFNWTVLDERDTIAGFRVQKATTSFAGRYFIAWFTEEIPISEGPYKFNGLPGLIVKIGDDKGHYVFELTRIKKLKDPIPFTFQMEDLIDTEKEKLSELEKEYKRDPVGFSERSVPGVKIQYGSGTDRKKIEQERKEKLKKQNNPLELR
ncbi:hypothetical protein GCM10007103_31860 [Salinimicrobium marinum]|uniref:GLPGLI family protein n=2 Tax=Salinimicrobium marinum TaxID=680283 RepID=A0A918W199_9FLAO|nr:hypothetical protein GCM10007103_31860 [Salinimicrobium marinum]